MSLVPVDHFQHRTILPGCNGFDASVTVLHNAIPGWYMSTPELQVHAPAARKFLKLPASERGVIVSQYLNRWLSFIKKKNHLQLTNETDEILALQWPPYYKTVGTKINKHQKMSTIVMGHVHCQPAPHTSSDNRFNSVHLTSKWPLFWWMLAT